jgi:hypothetical protein
MYTSRPRRRGAQEYQQAKEKRVRYSSRPSTRETYNVRQQVKDERGREHQQARLKRDTCVGTGQDAPGHINTGSPRRKNNSCNSRPRHM